MGSRGPAPLPTNIKIMRGNPGHQKLNRNEPKPRPVAPSCPAWLGIEAKREWRRISKELDALGLLTIVDRVAMAGYCQAYSRWRQAEEAISEHGLTMTVITESGSVERPRPEVAIAQKYLGIVKVFCAEFGLTPSSRGRMTLPEKEDDDDGLD